MTEISELEQFKKDCRAMSKGPLFEEIEIAYSKRQLERLEVATNLYLDYFEQFADSYVSKAKFYRAFSRHNRKPDLAREELEKLLQMSPDSLSSELRFFAQCNLEKLYPRDPNPIPKIVHLLYFGETDFLYFHYVCVKTVIQHMSDYRIIIYNSGKEPDDNKYWQEIRNDSRIEIEIISIPEEYDGYPLKHFQYKADVVRLQKLYEYGGVYLDLDMYLVKPLDSLLAGNRGLYLSFEHCGTVGPPIEGGLINCFLAAKPGNGFLKIWLESFKTGLRMENWAYHIRDTNRELLNQNPHYMIKYGIEIISSIRFCPFKWEETDKFLNMPSTIVSPNTYGVHLFETITGDYLCECPLFRSPNTDPPVSREETGIVVLTLAEYPDRRQSLERELERCGLLQKTHFIVNDLHKDPKMGCRLAHISAIKWAQKEGFREVCIFEDDIKVASQFSLEDRLKVENLPTSTIPWDMLYLGGILTSHKCQSKGWVRGSIWCNHAYIVHSRLYSVILEEFDKLGLYGEKENIGSEDPTIDWFYTSKIHPKYMCWLAEDQPIIQKAGYSTIDKKDKWGGNFSWDTWTLKTL